MKIRLPKKIGVRQLLSLFVACFAIWGMQGQTYYPRQTGNWNAGATWSTASCSGSAGTSIPSTIGHNVSITCSGRVVTVGSSASAGALVISSGTLTVNSTLNVTSLTMTGGTLNINGTLNVTGAVSITGGSVDGTGTLGLTGGIQTIACNQGIPQLNVAGSGNKTMSGNLNIEDELILTSNNLVVGSNLLTVGSSSAGSGMSRTNGRLTLSNTSSLSFGGSWTVTDIAPFISNTWPLTIQNFTMTRNLCRIGLGSAHNLTVTGNFTLTAGKFSIGSSVLTLNGPISGNINGSITGGASSDLTIGGSGASAMYFDLTNFESANGTNSIRNFTNNRTGTPFTMLSSMRVGGTLTQAASASLQISTGSFQTLSIDGNLAGVTNLMGSSGAGLHINGSGALAGSFNFSSNAVLSNLTMNRISATAVFNSAFSTSGLSLKWGVIDNANPITVTGSGTNAIEQSVASSYVKGRLLRTIAAGSANQTYFWPVGKSASQKITLNGISTSSGSAVLIAAEAFDGDGGGNADGSLETLNTDHYWLLTPTANAANLIAAGNVSLADNGLGANAAVAYAPTANGTFSSLGGTVASGAVTSTLEAPVALGYFRIGTGGAVCTDPDLAVIQPSQPALCGSGSVTLSVASGALNSAENWFWYAGSCEGTPVGTGSSISVSPSVTTTYYVRGEGGCITPGACSGITVTVGTPQTYYVDVDGDGFGNPALSLISCTGAPQGYVADNTDCDDTNANIHQTFVFYADADGDGYGSGSQVAVCALNADTPPTGFALNNFDCDDTDAAVYQTGTFYIDFDRDGFSSNLTETVCYGAMVPTGYLTQPTQLDCNDLVAAINPNATEILYNGVDDNCDGNLDEGFQIKTQLLANYCAVTLPALGSLVGIQTVSSAITGYRVRATSGSQVQTIEIPVPHFTMTQFANYAYATTYTIDIELQRYGVWLGYYGAACVVSTPAILEEGGAATVTGAQCGQTLPKINALISTTSLPGVTGYRFRVTNLSDPNGPLAEQTITRGVNWFSLPMLQRYNYGTTYRIEIAVKTNGDFGGYGTPCEIYAPAAPSLANCGGTATTGTQTVAATSVQGATYYRFQISRASDGAGTSMDRPVNYFTFNQLPVSLVQPGALYYVRVAVMTTGYWSPFGDICEYTAPGTAARGEADSVNMQESTASFKATAYPNPFAAAFKLELTGASQDEVSVKVYDMLGKLVARETFAAAEVTSGQMGANLPSGVYNVVVSQGGNLRSLRVIKR